MTVDDADGPTSAEIAERFTQIFRSGRWVTDFSRGETVSGDGSTLAYTENLRRELPRVVQRLGVTEIYDAPCGDFNWFAKIEWNSPVSYVGADIVAELVEQNQARYGGPGRRFVARDIISESPPRAGSDSLWICRDCLFHLSNAHIFRVLNHFVRSDYRYFLASTHSKNPAGPDIATGGFRPLNLELPPFSFPRAETYIEDWIEGYHFRQQGLWTQAQIRGALEAAGQLESSI